MTNNWSKDTDILLIKVPSSEQTKNNNNVTENIAHHSYTAANILFVTTGEAVVKV